MFGRVAESVAGPVQTPRYSWIVRAYDVHGVQLACRVLPTLTRAYRLRDDLVKAGAAVVVVEIV